MIRFATWAAVSTNEQVEGASLDNQIEKCKERGVSEKWIDTDLQYIADGYSRTGYVNLSDAEIDIPALGKMLSDLRAGKFDLLVVWNYDRLGDLIVMVATEFRKHKAQLFSLSQPTQIQQTYNPYMDDSSFIVQALAPIWQKQRIADFRRKWEAGMPKRVKDGLHPNRAPFGYKATKKGEPFEIVPAEAALVREMARLLMSGKSWREIAKFCNMSGIAPHRTETWGYSVIIVILKNPFYAGVIRWRKVKVLNKKVLKLPMSSHVVGQGKHPAIFTTEEFEEITAEINRRLELNKRGRVRFALSGMIYCSKCGLKLYRTTHKGKTILREEKTKNCKYTYYDIAFPKIAAEIQRSAIAQKVTRQEEIKIVDYSGKLADIEERLKRIQQATELGVYTPEAAAKRVFELQIEREAIHDKQAKQAELSSAMEFLMNNVDELEHMSEWIQDRDPQVVNQLLNSLIDRIEIYGEEIKVKWRGSGE